jgi:hypothetical protein
VEGVHRELNLDAAASVSEDSDHLVRNNENFGCCGAYHLVMRGIKAIIISLMKHLVHSNKDNAIRTRLIIICPH